MVKNALLRMFAVLVLLGISSFLVATPVYSTGFYQVKDSLTDEQLKEQVEAFFKKDTLSFTQQKLKTKPAWGTFAANDTVDVAFLTRSPFISVQQLLKGNVAGVYVQENNGEPGTIQSMLVRGLSSPVFSRKDLSGVQPVVYLNDIPLINDNSFIYTVQQYDVNPIGVATNLLAGLDINNVESIEIVKDPFKLAKLGPLAANGAVYITTKNGYFGGKHVSINGSMGMVAPPSNIRMTNAGYEKTFRQKFYDTYNITGAVKQMPAYLQDSRDMNYFGVSDWASSYYRYSPQYNINSAIGGGTPTANYLFTAGGTTNAGVADKTGFSKYNINFFLNMVPVKGLTVNAALNASQMMRDRNRNLRDRYAEIEYLPELSTPLSPTKTGYNDFLNKNKGAKDDNTNSIMDGSLGADLKIKDFYINARILLDYNTNVRHVFWPSTLMESVSYVSDYSGYNRRLLGKADLGYGFGFAGGHRLTIQWDGSIQSDAQHYNYTRAYDGDDDKKPTTSTGSYLMLSRYADRLDTRLASTSLFLDYKWKNIFNAGVLVRTDGTSRVQADSRWLFTPAFNIGWNIRNLFLSRSKMISGLLLTASWSRVGKIPDMDCFSVGPQYTAVDMNWSGQSIISSMNGYATITRPYSTGWIRYDIGWPYSDKLNVELTASLLNERLKLTLSYYDNTDKDLPVQIPVPQEFGYNYKYGKGMQINNKGIDLTLSATILANPKGFSWDASLNLNYNRNELKKLPGGVSELVIGDRKLEVGHAIDRFWLYQNRGIYGSDAEVPVKNTVQLSIEGIPFQKGDPKWTDKDNNNIIDDKDKTLTGHSLPPFTGGLTNQLRYKRFDLGFHLFWALGHSALNSRSQQRYDFATSDTRNTLAKVQEIFFWQNTNDNDDYPLYNPLSKVHPYRLEQNLFLEKLSYLKLRTLTLGYTLPLKKNKKEGSVFSPDKLYFYLTANNLFTITNFSGNDPELVEFNGLYTGYGQPIARSLTLGMKFNF